MFQLVFLFTARVLKHFLKITLKFSSNVNNQVSFDKTIKMRGNNPILALKLHILYLDVIYSYVLQTFINHFMMR